MITLVTGANGFVGKAITNSFLNKGQSVIALVRDSSNRFPEHVPTVIRDLTQLNQCEGPDARFPDDLLDALEEADVVIHTAARAHILKETESDPLFSFREVNTFATLKLAELAAKKKVKRFVFFSTIGVNGALSKKPFSESNYASPHNDYALSKWNAEKGLMLISEETGMEVVIIRPPLVYGAGAPGNFGKMLSYVGSMVPLPFGSVTNKRSLISLDNLVDFIALCADRELSPQAANQVFLISDDEDVSTTQLLQKIAKAYGKKQWLIPVPVSWMKFAAKLLGKSEQAERLFGNLQVDCSKAKNLLGWKPVITMDEQLKKMADTEK